MDPSFRDDLNDLDDDSDEEEEDDDDRGLAAAPSVTNPSLSNQHTLANELDDLEKDSDPTKPTLSSNNARETNESTSVIAGHQQRTLTTVAKLRKSERFRKHMAGLREVEERSAGVTSGAEYQLVMNSNRLVVDIDDEIATVHRYLVDLYSTKFPQLQSMVKNPVTFARTVRAIGNETDLTQVDLASLLPSATVMIVTVTASTAAGRPLTTAELKETMAASDEVIALDASKQRVISFVEERMQVIAPNVTALVGSSVTAELLAATGGLSALSKIPSGNVQVIGKEKSALAGFSSSAAMTHNGVIYNCEMIQGCPVPLRRKLARVLSGRVTLAARMDCVSRTVVAGPHTGQGGLVLSEGGGAQSAADVQAEAEDRAVQGRAWAAEIRAKLAKWQEPGAGKTKKALPVPDKEKKKKRGGRVARARKKRLGLTDMRRDANRMEFGNQGDEYGDSSMGLTLGMLGKEGSGNVRMTKSEYKLNAKKQQQSGKRKAGGPAGLSSSVVSSAGGGGGGGGVGTAKGLASGLQSSLAFTPVQGMVMADPQANAKRLKEVNQKYFAAHQGFKKR